ncbi:ABC transporter substrate-binding protein [bacterium]|nr:ABC transporter substrate-binding protein [bacterium]
MPDTLRTNRRTVTLALIIIVASVSSAPTRTIVDALGREVAVPQDVSHVICSGAGCLRLLTYLDGLDLVVAVDAMEVRHERFGARPYALANPHLRRLPVFGEMRGRDNPELILALDPRPDVIFKTWGASMGTEPDVLQAQTGIPVVALAYGDLLALRGQLADALRMMGRVIGRTERAEEVVAFLEATAADLARRSSGVADHDRPAVYLGGVAFKGPHGLASTEPVYPPFELVGARNLARDPDRAGEDLRQATVAREMIVAWDPDVVFLDLSTLQLGEDQGGLHELRHDPAYRTLSAVRDGRVYGLLPYNWYTRNFGSVLANAYFVGKTLQPGRFADVDPAREADRIYEFLVGAPVFRKMQDAFQGLVYRPVPVGEHALR